MAIIRSHVTNQLPATGLVGFREVCLLQLHVVPAKKENGVMQRLKEMQSEIFCVSSIQYYKWYPALVKALLEFYGREYGIVVALDDKSRFGVLTR